MNVTVTIPDASVDRVAEAVNNGPGNYGQNVTADNLADVLAAQWADDLRRAVQGHETSQAARTAALAVQDAQDPLSTSKTSFAEAAEARAVEVQALREAAAEAVVEAVEAVK